MAELRTPPERIQVAQDAEGFWTCREAVSGSQEYVRADLYEQAVRALEWLRHKQQKRLDHLNDLKSHGTLSADWGECSLCNVREFMRDIGIALAATRNEEDR